MKLTYKGAAAAFLACLMAGTVTASAVDYTKVASAADMTTVEEVGVEGMVPVTAADVADGTYEVEVESSSSMFKITKAVLTVENGEMTVDLTLSGTSYLVLYPGTGTEAAADTEDHYIGYTEDADGAYTYTIPVPALDQPFPCAAFSAKKEQWYDRSLLVRADSLPSEAVLVELPDYEALEKAAREARIEAMKGEGEETLPIPSILDLADGEYAINVFMEGGSGKASVASPATLNVKDGVGAVRLEWSSPNYDYMLVDGVRYEPVNTEGNSVFEVPVTVLCEPLTMIADTTAMSTPHEIEYTFTFTPVPEEDQDSAASSSAAEETGGATAANTAGAAIVIASAVVLGVLYVWLGRKERHG